jgi:hypothetical protein
MKAVKEESQILWNHWKIAATLSDRKFVMSAKILVQAISEMVLTMVKHSNNNNNIS